MIVKVDSREHDGKNQHVLEWFNANGIEYIQKVTLSVGDYMCARTKDTITLTHSSRYRKFTAISSKTHGRFRDECLRERDGTESSLLSWSKKIGFAKLSEVPMWLNPRRRYWEKIQHAHHMPQEPKRQDSRQAAALRAKSCM
jgi:hypothetical protein